MSLDALAYIKTRSPIRVSIVFALGILLPSAILSYIGLRSYQYEQRLTQKETEERYAVLANLVEKKVRSQFTALQNSLQKLADDPSVQRLETASLLPILLSPPPLEGTSHYELFVLDDSDRMVAPWFEGAQGGKVSERPEVDWGSLTSDIRRVERLEFVNKDFKGAIAGYAALQSRTSSPVLQAALLKNIAGDYRRLQDNRQAATTYLKLARSFEQVLDVSGYPMGILGRQMAIKLYEEDKNWNAALEVRLDLINALVLRHWKLPASTADTLMKELDAAIQKSGPHQRWERIRSVRERLRALEQAGQRFAQQGRPELLRRVHRQGRLEQAFLLPGSSGKPQQLVFAVPIRTAQSNRYRGLLVAAYPVEAVKTLLDATMGEATQASGLQVQWDGAGIAGASSPFFLKPSVQREIDVTDPPIRFRLVDASASLRDQFVKRRQWIFAGIIGLSFVVILVGLLIMAQALKREIEVANLKADFVANVSHELRTPLTVISQIEEKLSGGRFRSEDEKQEIYNMLGQQTGRLRGLVDDFLDFSKVLAGKKIYLSEPVELRTLVQEAVDLFEPKAQGKGFEINARYPDDPVTVLGDTKAIIQVVLNLLDNAMKYSGDARVIDVVVRMTSSSGLVEVKDQGIGISTIDQDKIFEKFYRVEKKGSARLHEGVGLGLAMVKHVMDSHKGKITVQSHEGKGSLFTLSFPRAAILS